MVCTSAVFQLCGVSVSVCTCPLLLSTTFTAAQSLVRGRVNNVSLRNYSSADTRCVCVCGVCVFVCLCVCVCGVV